MASAMCFYLDVGDGFEVGDGAGDFEDSVVGAGAEALLLHGALEDALGSEESSQ